MVFSHSRLNTYESCPRKYAFRYIEKPPIEEHPSVEAFMGSMVHEALEKLYRSVQMERIPKWEEIRDFYEDTWQRNWEDDILIVRSEFTGDDYRNVGRRCLQDYFVGHYPFSEGRILGLEERILFDLDPDGRYKIQGYIDRLVEGADGAIEIHDYKTNRRLPSQAEIDAERQLALYQIGIQSRWDGTHTVRLYWHFLRANRTLKSVRSPESLTELRADTIRLIDTIEAARAGNDFPPHESQLCAWCEFQSLCPAKRHLFATATLTPQQFAADSGVRLVDRFVAAARHKAQSEAELQAVRQEVIEFAGVNNLTRIQGHHASVGIHRRWEQTIPNQDDPNRKLLESLVRASGYWEKVSDLSRSKLPKALQGDLFDPATRQRIASLLPRNEIVVVTKREDANDERSDGPDV
ncbi:MAG: PD-(D/E)XK nuclease family protein [Candidatus Zixiibacteriota bacterium]